LLPLLVLGLLITLLVFFLRRRPAASAPPDQAEIPTPSSEDSKQKLTHLKEMLDEVSSHMLNVSPRRLRFWLIFEKRDSESSVLGEAC
jgi:hypothetical protein